VTSARFDGRVCIVTGAAAGIGRAIARRFADEGATVVATDIADGLGAETVEEIERDGGKAQYVHLDVTETALIGPVFNRVVEAHGRIDVLVNNAGVTGRIPLEEMSERDWDRIMSINAKGAFFCMQAAVAPMKAAKAGVILNISSIAGKGWRHASSHAYASSKSAMLVMTRKAAAELAANGVRVNAICPGVTETNLVGEIVNETASAEGIEPAVVRDRLLDQVPLRRINRPEDIAAAAAFLASDEAWTITGQALDIDGGILLN
jgi:3-oxoacyl-[acyl-carrier protein] reductase